MHPHRPGRGGSSASAPPPATFERGRIAKLATKICDGWCAGGGPRGCVRVRQGRIAAHEDKQ